MDELDKRIRRTVLKPLVYRSHRVRDRRAILNALQRLDTRALGVDLAKQLRDVVAETKDDKKKPSWKDPDRIRRTLELTRALYASRLFCTQEYLFHVVWPLDLLATDRAQDDRELEQISHAIGEIRKKHGLKDEEDLRIGEGPEEYIHLNKQWDARYNKLNLDVLREFGFNDLADLAEQSPDEFSRLRERGRRSVAHKDEYEHALRDIILRHEQDAERTAAAGVYSAAVTSLGAGVEGLLLLRCLESKAKTVRTGRSLPKRNRPRFPEDPTTWSFETLIEVCLRAGWLPSLENSSAKFNSAALAHIVRTMRNQVHPGRQAKEKPWCETDKRDYEDAIAIYITLLSALKKDKKIWTSKPIPRQ